MNDPTTWSILKEWGFAVAAIVAITLFILNRFFTQYGTIPLKDRIRDGHWAYLIDDYTQTRRNAYFEVINRLLDVTANFWGPNRSLQSLQRCLQIALIYPSVAILVGWVWGNVSDLGGLDVFSGAFSLEQRLWRGAAVIVLMYLLGKSCIWLMNRSIKFDRDLDDFMLRLHQRGGPLSKVPTKVFRWANPVIYFICVILTAVIFTVLFSVILTPENVTTGIALICVAGFAAFDARLGISVGILLAVLASDAQSTSIYLLFFTILPVLNGVADFLSLSATRYFLKRLNPTTATFKYVFWQLVLDICVAALCLVGLIATLVFVLDIWAAVAPLSLGFEWRVYWADVRAGNMIAAAPLFLMVITTLLPTAIHLTVGLAGLSAAESRTWKRAVVMMKDMQINPNSHDPNKIIRLIGRGRLIGTAYTLLILIPLYIGIIWGVTRLIGVL